MESNVLEAIDRLRRSWSDEDFNAVYPANEYGFGQIYDMELVSKWVVQNLEKLTKTL